MPKSELTYLVNSEKSKIDWDIRVTLSRIHSAHKIARGYNVTIFDIIYAIKNNNGKLVEINVQELLKDLKIAREEGYVNFENRKYSLTAKGIDVVGGEKRLDLERLQLLQLRNIKYRNR